MSKKTPKQAAEGWVQGRYGCIATKFFGNEEFTPHPCLEAFLAGRKHFVEHELREYLEMAVVLGIEKRLIDPGIEEIINKAKED